MLKMTSSMKIPIPKAIRATIEPRASTSSPEIHHERVVTVDLIADRVECARGGGGSGGQAAGGRVVMGGQAAGERGGYRGRRAAGGRMSVVGSGLRAAVAHLRERRASRR